MGSTAGRQQSDIKSTNGSLYARAIMLTAKFAFFMAVAIRLATAALPKATIATTPSSMPPVESVDACVDEPLMATAKQCSQCRKTIPRGSLFCALCGAEQPHASVAKAS